MITLKEAKNYLRVDYDEDDKLIQNLLLTAKNLVMDIGRMDDDAFTQNEDTVRTAIDANGEAENFYADNGVYYVINNNAGYTGDLEIALITTEFATEILGEILDNNGVLVERNDTELAQFALMFEFLGDKHHIRHVMYCCSASRPATESATTEESTEVKTEKLSLKATPLPTGLVKSKTTESTSDTVYNNWFKMPYSPNTKTSTTTTTTTTS